MEFAYYIVQKKNMKILEGASDVVSAINMAKKYNCACLILQACVITEIGQDIVPEPEVETESEEVSQENVQSEIIE